MVTYKEFEILNYLTRFQGNTNGAFLAYLEQHLHYPVFNSPKETLTILAELQKPGRDPREDLPQPILRTDVLDIKDLKPGMELMGTVRNVIDFGVFVDIGVHQDGLVHISRMANRFIKHPSEAAKVGDRVKVWVVEVDEKKKRIALSMIPPVQK